MTVLREKSEYSPCIYVQDEKGFGHEILKIFVNGNLKMIELHFNGGIKGENVGWLVALGFNATLTAKVMSWR